MKANNSKSSSQLLMLAFWAISTAIPAGAFVSPGSQHPLGASTGRASGGITPGASRSDASPIQSVGSGPSELADRTRSVRNQMRDAIWKASDAVTHAVEELPSIGPGTNETLARLGSMVEDIDDKYFGKFRGVGATTSYLDSIGVGSAGTAGGPPKDDKPEKEEGEEKEAPGQASSIVASVVSEVAEASDAASEVASASANAAVKSNKKGDAPAETAAAAVDAAVKTAPQKQAGSAAGTVQLDRPKQVQGVFDDLQKKAVEYYKSSPVAKTTGSVPGVKVGSPAAEGVTAPLPDAVQILEAKLEALLEESKFKPRKLKKEKKVALINALKEMEDAYPADANPLADPALSGQWSVVYSSSSRPMGRALKGALSRVFKTSDARQVINSEASSVINACRARLRMTPLALRLAQKGSYKATAERKVSVNLSPRQRGLLRRLLPSLRSGKVEAEVTYLSNRWRICRTGGVTVAFRKNGD